MPKNPAKTITIIKRSDGFTLLEALLSVVLLGFLAITVATVYSSGNQSLDAQADYMLLESKLCSRMEFLVGTEFSALGNGSEVVTINGNNYQIVWAVAPIDLNGDMTPETNARQITVSVAGLSNYSLTTIRIDHQDTLGKIS